MTYLIIAVIAHVIFSAIHPRPEDRDLHVLSILCTFLVGFSLAMVYLQHIT